MLQDDSTDRICEYHCEKRQVFQDDVSPIRNMQNDAIYCYLHQSELIN
jgi:hypothetical protein